MRQAKEKENILIQDRDIEILKFCLEMKFSGIESLNEMYFDSGSIDMFAARKRVQKLEASQLLKSVKLLSGTPKKFYIVTPKGHREIQAKFSLAALPKPVTKLSVVTFQHDLGVLQSRMLLEKQGRATHWKSERLLKSQAELLTGKLSRDFMPDGIFTSKQNKICAFEYENKPKTEKQLLEKILRLNAVISDPDPVFEACLFVTSTESLRIKIKKITDNYSKKFVVQSMSDLVKAQTASSLEENA